MRPKMGQQSLAIAAKVITLGRYSSFFRGSRGAAMAASTRIVDLIVRWQDLRAQGQAITPDELCAESPELLDEFQRRLQELASLASMMKTPPADDQQAISTVTGAGKIHTEVR